ncbi:MAG TPA: HAD family hydrolase, partial [Candidatus Tumulicola sp.]
MRNDTSSDPLSLWNDGPPKRAILEFVGRVTAESSNDYVAPVDRIVLFDNDGTLWVEQPMYTQMAFILDDVRRLAPQHPEWSDTEPFKSVLKGDFAAVAAAGVPAIMQLVATTQSGMTADQFSAGAMAWIESARHGRFDQLYTDCVYQPMLQLLAFLRANDFEVYIVSGGGTEFIRPWAERVYGVPPQRVVGSTLKTKFEMRDGTPTLVRLPDINLVNDG